MIKLDFPSNKKIAAAVSGGVDSMVMLSFMLKMGLKPLVLTVDHGIRGEDSTRDAQFVADFCAEHGVECQIFKVDVPAMQKESGLSTELQARELRYGVFERVLREGCADVVSLAHHLSDQAETILMRCMRGTGVGGLAGIEDRDGYIHPLLHFTREEIERYALQNAVPFREDKTNLLDGYMRNFIRNRILPVVRERCPTIERQLEKLAESAKETEDFIAGFLMAPQPYANGIRFLNGVFDLHNAVLKRSVLKGLQQIGIVKDVEEPALNAVCALKQATSGTELDIGQNLVARREYQTLIIEPKEELRAYKKPFIVSQTYEFGYRYEFLAATTIERGITFDLDKIPEGAEVRTRCEGDRFQRAGGGGKSLSDYFTDIKLPKRERNLQLVLAKGSVVYAVLGVEVSESVKVDNNTKQMIQVKRSYQ